MKLRAFLVKRAIHTIITLMVVLLLLFVIFRLMPSDPSRMMIRPGMSPEAQDLLRVQYGFSKIVPAPDNIYETRLIVNQPGLYEVEVRVKDYAEGEDSVRTTFSVNSGTRDIAPPSIKNVTIEPNANDVIISAFVEDASTINTVIANITLPNELFADELTLQDEDENDTYNGTFLPLLNGLYRVRITAADVLGNTASAYASFTANYSGPDIQPPTMQNLTVLPNPVYVDEDATISLEVIDTSIVSEVLVNIIYPNGTFWIETNMNSVGDDVYAIDITSASIGKFTVIVNATDSEGNEGTAFTSFVVNVKDVSTVPPVSDTNIEGLITKASSYATGAPIPIANISDSVRISANITGTNLNYSSAEAIVTSPDGSISYYRLIHRNIIVPRSMFEQFVVYVGGMIPWPRANLSVFWNDVILKIPHTYHLGEGLRQFGEFFGNFLSYFFDFGNSFISQRPAAKEIGQRTGATLLLFGSALVISTIVGVLLGALMAWRRGSAMEISTIVVTLFFYSMPLFWIGLIFLWIFAFKLHAFPLGGIGGFDPSTGDRLWGWSEDLDILWHLTLPLLTLLILHLAGYTLLMRNSMLEVLGEDYITTAKAKGIGETKVTYKHAARNALLPVVTSVAISMGWIISGGVLTETIFSWPGMGYLLVYSTLSQDYPVVQAAFYIIAIMTILANFVADVLYAYLDPRVKL